MEGTVRGRHAQYFSRASRPGMHRAYTIDWITIFEGEIELILDDARIQRGTWHAWTNRRDEPCVFQDMMIALGPLPD